MTPMRSAGRGILLAAILGTTGLVYPAFAQENGTDFGLHMEGDYGTGQDAYNQDDYRMGQDAYGQDGYGLGQDDADFGQGQWDRSWQGQDDTVGYGRAMPDNQLFGLVCSTGGSEQLEIAMVRLSYRLELSDRQRPLFDDLRATALLEQRRFVDTCEAAQEAGQSDNRTLVDRLKQQLAIQTARTQALSAVLPKLEAFYGSLNEEQIMLLDPASGRNNFGPEQGGWPQPSDGMEQPVPDGQRPSQNNQRPSQTERQPQQAPDQPPAPSRQEQPGRQVDPGRQEPGRQVEPGRQQEPGRQVDPGRQDPGRQLDPGRQQPGRNNSQTPGNTTTAPGNEVTSPGDGVAAPGNGFTALQPFSTQR